MTLGAANVCLFPFLLCYVVLRGIAEYTMPAMAPATLKFQAQSIPSPDVHDAAAG